MTQIPRMLRQRPGRICRKTVYIIALLSSTFAYAQLFTFSKQELIDYKAKSPFDRLADGCPNDRAGPRLGLHEEHQRPKLRNATARSKNLLRCTEL